MKSSPTDSGSPLRLDKDRLLSLIDFAQQSARLRSKSTANLSAHGIFDLYEHELQGLPGIQVNIGGPEGEDEIWLAVKRLHESSPPDIASAILRPWIQMTHSPTDEPRLRETLDGSSLISACSSNSRAVLGKSNSNSSGAWVSVFGTQMASS